MIKARSFLVAIPKLKEIQSLVYPLADYWILLAKTLGLLQDKDGVVATFKQALEYKAQPHVLIKQTMETTLLEMKREADLQNVLDQDEKEILTEAFNSKPMPPIKPLTPKPLSVALKSRMRAEMDQVMEVITTPSKLKGPKSSATPISDKLARKLELIDKDFQEEFESEVKTSPVQTNLLERLENIHFSGNEEESPEVGDIASLFYFNC